ncbi:hypothetical protein R4P53_25975, partial [Rhodococcus sp. IEGM 1414]|nr:hypothetical protein [Rhodococcus sp. IEGM 1414]
GAVPLLRSASDSGEDRGQRALPDIAEPPAVSIVHQPARRESGRARGKRKVTRRSESDAQLDLFSFDADGAAPIDPAGTEIGGTPLPAPVDPEILAADATSRQARELQPAPEVAPDVAAAVSAPTPSATELVRDAYGRLAREDEAYVRLARIRASLDGTLTADQVTDALMELRRAGDVSLIPEENQKTLGPD